MTPAVDVASLYPSRLISRYTRPATTPTTGWRCHEPAIDQMASPMKRATLIHRRVLI
jgi:hypothetical protein